MNFERIELCAKETKRRQVLENEVKKTHFIVTTMILQILKGQRPLNLCHKEVEELATVEIPKW